MTMMRRVAAVLAAATGLYAFAVQAAPVKAVASFSILGDMTRRIGGDDVALTTLVGPGGDAHVYQPTPADARAVAAADVVIVNGLGFEGWLDRLVKSAGYKGAVATAGKGVKPLREADDHDHGHDRKAGGDHDHHGPDPHAWQSVANAQIYADNILAALSRAAPDRAAAFQARHAAYRAELAALEQEIRAAFAAIPRKSRKIVTSHDAFGYYAAAYDVTFLAPVGVSTDAEPAAADIARLIRQIKKEQVRAIFVENISDPRMLAQISLESGASIGPAVFSDALAVDGPAASYIGMMRHNTQAFIAALTAKD